MIEEIPIFRVDHSHRDLTGESGLLNSMFPCRKGVYKVVDKEDIVCWCEDGVIHRAGKPAKFWPNGSRAWLERGMLHRLDGPAVEYPLNDHYTWWIMGRYITSFKEFQQQTKCSDEDILLFMIKYGELVDINE